MPAGAQDGIGIYFFSANHIGDPTKITGLTSSSPTANVTNIDGYYNIKAISELDLCDDFQYGSESTNNFSTTTTITSKETGSYLNHDNNLVGNHDNRKLGISTRYHDRCLYHAPLFIQFSCPSCCLFAIIVVGSTRPVVNPAPCLALECCCQCGGFGGTLFGRKVARIKYPTTLIIIILHVNDER